MTHTTTMNQSRPVRPTPDNTARATSAILDIDDIDVDSYHRPPSDIRSTFGNGWNPEMFTPIVVAERDDGTHHVIDGVRRLAAARQHGFRFIEAIIVHVGSRAREAELTTAIASAPLKLHAQDRYRSQLTAGDPITLAIEDVLSEHGLTGLHDHPGDPREVKSVTALRSAWPRTASGRLTPRQLDHGRTVLEWVVDAARPLIETGAIPAHALNSQLVRSLVWIRQHAIGVPDAARVGAVLATVPTAYLRDIIDRSTGVSHGGYGRAATGALRLARWVNERSHKDLIEVPQRCWN